MRALQFYYSSVQCEKEWVHEAQNACVESTTTKIEIEKKGSNSARHTSHEYRGTQHNKDRKCLWLLSPGRKVPSVAGWSLCTLYLLACQVRSRYGRQFESGFVVVSRDVYRAL